MNEGNIFILRKDTPVGYFQIGHSGLLVLHSISENVD
jgi:hypothetical protein